MNNKWQLLRRFPLVVELLVNDGVLRFGELGKLSQKADKVSLMSNRWFIKVYEIQGVGALISGTTAAALRSQGRFGWFRAGVPNSPFMGTEAATPLSTSRRS